MKCKVCGEKMSRIDWNEVCDLAICDNYSCSQFHTGISIEKPNPEEKHDTLVPLTSVAPTVQRNYIRESNYERYSG